MGRSPIGEDACIGTRGSSVAPSGNVHTKAAISRKDLPYLSKDLLIVPPPRPHAPFGEPTLLLCPRLWIEAGLNLDYHPYQRLPEAALYASSRCLAHDFSMPPMDLAAKESLCGRDHCLNTRDCRFYACSTQSGQ